MAQSTAGFSGRNLKIEYAVAASTGPWYDISGSANEVTPGGGERPHGEFFTFSGDTPIVTEGKRGAVTLAVKILFTEGTATTDPYESIRPYYEDGTAIYLRFSPRGTAAGYFQFTSDAGYVKNLLPPAASASSPEALSVSMAFVTAKMTKGTIS